MHGHFALSSTNIYLVVYMNVCFLISALSHAYRVFPFSFLYRFYSLVEIIRRSFSFADVARKANICECSYRDYDRKHNGGAMNFTAIQLRHN